MSFADPSFSSLLPTMMMVSVRTSMHLPTIPPPMVADHATFSGLVSCIHFRGSGLFVGLYNWGRVKYIGDKSKTPLKHHPDSDPDSKEIKDEIDGG